MVTASFSDPAGLSPRPRATVSASPDTRFRGLDALRGAAALSVMFFHYTTRYQEKFGHLTPPSFHVDWGFLGVNLFFMISGFVIFMTLERTRSPEDFLFSRFFRLFPAYWGAAVLAFTITRLAPELGMKITNGQALANVLMIHGMFGVPHIDGVYWTLEIELLFYWAMFVLWLSFGFAKPQRWMAVWLAISIAAGLAERAGLRVPYIVSHALILIYFPYFALGILLYLCFVRRVFRWRIEGLLGAASLLAVSLVDSPTRVFWAIGFTALFPLVLLRWSAALPVRALARIGIFSYALYLVHETIGWTVIRHLEDSGWRADAAIAAASVAAMAGAYLLHRCIERPAMQWSKEMRRRTIASATAETPVSRRRWVVGTLALGIMVLLGNRLALLLAA